MMFKLLKYLKEYKKEAVLAPLFKMSEALLELFVPLIVSSLIDVGINGTGGREYIVKMCLLLVLFGLAGLGLSVTAQYFAAKAAVGFTKQVRFRLFEHIQQMEYSKLWDEYEAAQLEADPTKEINKDLLEGAIYRKYCSNQMVPNTIKMTDDFISQGEKVIIQEYIMI